MACYQVAGEQNAQLGTVRCPAGSSTVLEKETETPPCAEGINQPVPPHSSPSKHRSVALGATFPREGFSWAATLSFATLSSYKQMTGIILASFPAGDLAHCHLLLSHLSCGENVKALRCARQPGSHSCRRGGLRLLSKSKRSEYFTNERFKLGGKKKKSCTSSCSSCTWLETEAIPSYWGEKKKKKFCGHKTWKLLLWNLATSSPYVEHTPPHKGRVKYF